MAPYEGQTTTLAGNGTLGNTTRSNDEEDELLSGFMLALPHAILVTVMLAFLALSFLLYKRRKAKNYRHMDRIKSHHESVAPHSTTSWSNPSLHERRVHHHHRRKKAKRLRTMRSYFRRHAFSTTPEDHHDHKGTPGSVRRQPREEPERRPGTFWWWRRGNIQTKLYLRRGEGGEDGGSKLELRPASRTPSRTPSRDDVFLP